MEGASEDIRRAVPGMGWDQTFWFSFRATIDRFCHAMQFVAHAIVASGTLTLGAEQAMGAIAADDGHPAAATDASLLWTATS